MLTSLSDISHCRGGIILSGWNTAYLVWASECLRFLCFVFIAKLDSISQSYSELPRIQWSAVFKDDGCSWNIRCQLQTMALLEITVSANISSLCVTTVPTLRIPLNAILMKQKFAPNSACRLCGFRQFTFTQVRVLTTLAWKPCLSLLNQRCISI